MNKKELTKKESELSDLFLEELLTVTDKCWVRKYFISVYFEKFGVNEDRYFLICQNLAKKDLIQLNKRPNDQLFTINIEKINIRNFLNNGGMTELWLKRNKLLYDFRMSKFKVVSFYWLFAVSIFSGIFSVIKIVQYIKSEFKVEKVEGPKLKKEEVKGKSNTLILSQKYIDSLNSPDSENK